MKLTGNTRNIATGQAVLGGFQDGVEVVKLGTEGR